MGVTKQCTVCLEDKELSYFYKQASCKLGVRPYCIECDKKKAIANANKNKERTLSKQRAWRQKNKEKYLAVNKKWHESETNRMKWKAYQAHYQRARELLKQNATPKWLTEYDLLRLRCIYQVAAMRSRESGFLWEVDHVVPIKGKTVCGLHVPWNLQIIPMVENRSKSNKFEVT